MPMSVINPVPVDTIVFTRAGTATYQDANAVLQTAITDQRRETFTLGPRNLLTYSEQFDNAIWAKIALTMTANNTTAPDGTLTADRVLETATTAAHYIQRAPIRLRNESYTYSLYCKAIGPRGVLIRVTNPAGTYKWVAFNLTAGTIITTSGTVTGTITAAANGFFRCSVTVTASEAPCDLLSSTCDLTGNITTVGNVTYGLYLWGAQLEFGTSVGTYIPTTTEVGVAAGVANGYIYEPNAATNLMTNSRADSAVVTGGSWTLGPNAVRVGSTIAPDGTNTATVYRSNAVGNVFVVKALALAANTVYTVSIWAKVMVGAPTFGTVILCEYDNNGNGATIEYSALPIPGSGLDNIWRRFSLTFTNVAAMATANCFFAADFDVGVEIAVWGAQVEVGSLSSFIPTTTAAVTRQAELLIGTTNNFVSSSVPEADYALWNPVASYAIGTRVMRPNHRNYENLISGIDATRPEAAPTRWLDIGPTNRWAMFDKTVGTLTVGTSPLTVVLRPGQVDSIAFQELYAESVQVTVRDTPGGTIVFDEFIDLEFAQITDFYEWFFEPYEARTDALLTNIPPYPDCEITVTITGSGNVRVGLMIVGNNYLIGDTQYGAQIGILNFSVKETDQFGNTTIVPRGFARRMDIKVWMPAIYLNRTYKLLSDLKDTPCIWIATDVQDYESMIVYGFYRDFTIDIAYFSTNVCNLQIEGLT